jgi:hypothetical protein
MKSWFRSRRDVAAAWPPRNKALPQTRYSPPAHIDPAYERHRDGADDVPVGARYSADFGLPLAHCDGSAAKARNPRTRTAALMRFPNKARSLVLLCR